jgi:hypothetical protein
LFFPLHHLNGCPKHMAQSKHCWTSWSFFMKLFHVIHPSISSSIHGWHHVTRPSICPVIYSWMASYREKTLAEINNPPPSAHAWQSKKGMPGPRGGGATPRFWYQYQQQTQHWTLNNVGYIIVSSLLAAVCCYLTGHKQCKHQDFQRPGSQWIHAECDI